MIEYKLKRSGLKMKLPEVSKEELKRHSKKYIAYTQRVIDTLGDGL